MIAVDTNVVVRLLTQDDEQQYNKSLKLFQEQDIFISNTVILETEWVLRFAGEAAHLAIESIQRSIASHP